MSFRLCEHSFPSKFFSLSFVSPSFCKVCLNKGAINVSKCADGGDDS